MLNKALNKLTELHDRIEMTRTGDGWRVEAFVGERSMLWAVDADPCNAVVIACMALTGKLPLTTT